MISRISDTLYKLYTDTQFGRQGSYNSYLVRGERELLIDAGGMEGSDVNLDADLAELGVDRNRLDFFSTHSHSDHSSAVGMLAGKGSRLYIHKAAMGLDVSKKRDARALCGLPEKVADTICVGSISSPLPENMEICYVDDGAEINVGDYRFTCIHTPGHADEHLCLYEREKKLIFCGDTVLDNTVPFIPDYSMDSCNYEVFFNTLDMLEKLEVEQIFSGHGHVDNYYRAIATIRSLHEMELKRRLGKLSHVPQSVHELLSEHNWDFDKMYHGTVCTIYFRVYALLNFASKNGMAKQIICSDGIHRFLSV